MERNQFASDASSSTEPSGSSAAGGSTSGATSGAAGESGSDGAGITDRARDMAGSARDKLADVGSTVRDRAGTAKDSLADALESGADRLRQRTGGGAGQFAGATGSGSMAVENDGRVAQVGDKVATGMQATADWLRDANLDGLRTSVEEQVRDHPGRTLLIAVGVGYLLGKAFRK